VWPAARALADWGEGVRARDASGVHGIESLGCPNCQVCLPIALLLRVGSGPLEDKRRGSPKIVSIFFWKIVGSRAVLAKGGTREAIGWAVGKTGGN